MEFFKRLFRRLRRSRPATAKAPESIVQIPDGGGIKLIGGPDEDTPYVIVEHGPSVMVMDRMAFEFQQGLRAGTLPNQAELDEVLRTVDRVRVIEGGMIRSEAFGIRVLADTRDRADVEGFRKAIQIVEDPSRFQHCMCLGGPTVECYNGKSLVATISIHHGTSLRWPQWKFDAPLADSQALVEWMDRKGIPLVIAPDQKPISPLESAGGTTSADPPKLRAKPSEPESDGDQADPNHLSDLQLLSIPADQRLANRAYSYLGRSETFLATDECEKALRVNPDSPMALGVRSLIHRASERYEESERDADRAIELGLKHPEVFLARAIARSARGELAEAHDDCEQALTIAPDSPNLYNSRGLFRMQMGRVAEATDDFRRAIELAPQWPTPRGNLAQALLQAEQHEEALTEATRAIRLVEKARDQGPAALRDTGDQPVSSYYLSRARIHEALQDVDAAAADLESAIEVDPELPSAYLARGYFRSQHDDFPGALEDFSEAIELRPDMAQGYFYRSQVFARLDRLDEARGDLDQGLLWSPDDPNLLICRGQILMGLGEFRAAANDFSHLIRLVPESPPSYYLRARCRSMLQDHPAMREDLETLLRIAPEWWEPCNSLSWLLSTCPDDTIRDGPRALELAKRAVESAPDDNMKAAALDTLAAALAESGQFELAADTERQALDLIDDVDRRLDYQSRLSLYESGEPFRQTVEEED